MKKIKYECEKCSKKFTPARKPRKNIICPKCKRTPVKYKCINCGTEEKPLKRARKKTFSCKSCRKERREVNKIIRSKTTINLDDLESHLKEHGFQSSTTGILYKNYGSVRVSIGTELLSAPTLVLKKNNSSECFIDAGIIKELPFDSLKELVPVVNTITEEWKKFRG